MQGRHDRNPNPIDEVEDERPVLATEEPVLVLDRDDRDARGRHPVGRPNVIPPIVRRDQSGDFERIEDAIPRPVNGHDLPIAHGSRQVPGERCYAAATRRVGRHEGDAGSHWTAPA